VGRSFDPCSRPGGVERPSGVTMDGEGNILLMDRNNHLIYKFKPEGQYSTSVGTKGSGHLQFFSSHWHCI
jgi:hypothetical protein